MIGPMMSEDKLPANVRPVIDRHGKTRYRFRKKGFKSAYLPGQPNEAAFHKAYAAIIEGGPMESGPVASPAAVIPRSLDDIYTRYKKSPRWKKKGARTQYKQGQVLERFLDRIGPNKRRYGERPVSRVTVAWLDNILGEMWETPAAANELRKCLRGLMETAIKAGWREDNPVNHTDRYQEGEGHHTWTDDEIQQYRDHHPLGTMARLTMELALNTAARRGNVCQIERDHIENGHIYVDHLKDNNAAWVLMLPMTRAAIEALPAAPIKHLVITEFGRPFTPAGLGNKFRDWSNQAGLKHCSLHGLRKARSRLLAESGATDAQGQAITGHKKDETFREYRAAANRSKLADTAMSNLASPIDAQPKKEGPND
jgi:integrase